MTSRRAGQRLRIEAKRRRIDLLRVIGWKLALGTICWIAVVAVLAAFLYITVGRDGAFLAIGAGMGAYAVMALTAFQLIDPVGARLYSGLDGETNTARELRRLKSAGWTAVHNLHFKAGDVDHVAVGPGGVVVIETKSSHSDWRFLERRGVVDKWADQAKRGALRVKGVVKQYSGISVDPIIVVAAWLPGQARPRCQTTDDTVRLNGSDLHDYLAELPRVLEPADVATISHGLEQAGEQFDHAAGIRHPGRLRRMIGFETAR